MKDNDVKFKTIQENADTEEFLNDTVWEKVYEDAGLKSRFNKSNF